MAKNKFGGVKKKLAWQKKKNAMTFAEKSWQKKNLACQIFFFR
jgi:hypothetical protein